MYRQWHSAPGLDGDPRRKYFCDLCQKGYARLQDLEHHENDYDHQHRKREKDRKELSRDHAGEARARIAERRANEEAGIRKIIPKQPLKTASHKTALFTPIDKPNAVPQTAAALLAGELLDPSNPSTATIYNDPSGAVRNGWYNDRYDPNFITGCDSSCSVCRGMDGAICL